MDYGVPPWLLLLAGAAVTYSFLRRWTTLDLFKIPTPWGLPYVGQLIQLSLCVYNPHQQFLKWHEKLGAVVRLRIFHRDVVLVADPQVAAQLLAKGPNECYRRAPEYATYDAAHGMSGQHAIMTELDEERWRTIRKGIAPAYSMVAIRENFPTLVRCYTHICQRIADGTAWLEPPGPPAAAAAAAASILSSDATAAAASISPGDAAAAASKLSRSSSIDASRRSSIEASRQSLSRTCSIDATSLGCHSSDTAAAAAAAAAVGRAVCIDEEIFAATTRVLTEGFLRIPAEALGSVDYQQAAADVSGLIAITNSFLSQPWKKWLYLGIPGLCQESRDFHAQRNRLMQLTDTLASHVEAHRKKISSSSSSSSTAAAADGLSAAAAEAGRSGSGGGGHAVAAVSVSSGVDASLVGCLAKLREPHTGELFSHEALQAELFLETVGQESIPWTMAWTLFLLIQHPDAEARVMQELRAAGLPCNGDPAAAAAGLSLELLKQLPYCTAVLQEAMRLFPAGVMAASRMTQQTTQVGPYQVPAGTIVFPCIYSLMMYSGNWDAPTEFRPERWLEPGSSVHPATGANRFVPFGIGPKACVAQQLAYTQLKVLMVLLLSSFKWQLAPCMGGPEGVLASTVAALELRVDKGMWLLPTPRTVA